MWILYSPKGRGNTIQTSVCGITLTIDLGRRLRQPAGAGDQLALQAAAGTDLKHRLVGLADGEFESGGMALALEGVGQRLQPVGRRFGCAEEIRRSDAEAGAVGCPPLADALGIGPGQVLVLVEGH